MKKSVFLVIISILGLYQVQGQVIFGFVHGVGGVAWVVESAEVQS